MSLRWPTLTECSLPLAHSWFTKARDTPTAAGGSDVASGVTGQCANSGTALASGSELDVAIPTSVVPSGAQAVVLNVTAIGATAPGFLSVYAATGAAPSSPISNVNFAAGQDVANSVTVAANAGAVDVYFGPASPSASVNVAVDVQGYYSTPSSTTGDPYKAITPTRICDTRSTSAAGGSDVTSGLTGQCANSGTAVASGSVLNVAIPTSVVPSGAQAVALNVTATGGTASSYLTAYPTGATRPVTSNQNWMPGETLASQVVSKVGTGGDVSLYNFAGNVNYVVDVDGYFAPPVSAVTVTAAPSELNLGSTATSTITVTVNHTGTPVSGDTVVLSASPSTGVCGTPTQPTTTTGANGQTTGTITAGSVVGTCTVTASEANYGMTGTATVVTAANNTVSVTPTRDDRYTCSGRGELGDDGNHAVDQGSGDEPCGRRCAKQSDRFHDHSADNRWLRLTLRDV
jgi:hypothetical protein